MIPRYAKDVIDRIWSDREKTNLWRNGELALIKARALLGRMSGAVAERIIGLLRVFEVDLELWKRREADLKHDYNAYIACLREPLAPEDRRFVHQDITTYDGEEQALTTMIKESLVYVHEHYRKFRGTLKNLAIKYRYTLLLLNTHGQAAELGTFGQRVLHWIRDLDLAFAALEKAEQNLEYSKMSGATGNYTTMDPELEERALELLGFKPYYGATQIMPRVIHALVAQSLCNLVLMLHNIALDIRLGAMSTRPIYQEPFGKKQTGSSAMPHKKNTISTEQIEGMARLAKSYMNALTECTVTWLERAIEQSCVERIAWPDLFHVTLHSFETMDKVMSGLNVYPDNMLLDIYESKGCYATNPAKEWLAEMVAGHGLEAEDAYRMVQLAAFNAHEPHEKMQSYRNRQPNSVIEADRVLKGFFIPPSDRKTIETILVNGQLVLSARLDITPDRIKRWNEVLADVFASHENRDKFYRIFQPSFLLRNEGILYQEVLEI